MNARTASRTDFKATACVDFLDVTIHTSRATQFRHVQNALERITGIKLYTNPRDRKDDTGQNATVFTIRFRDALANDPLALMAAINEFRREYSFRAEPTIGGIEVACDFRYKGQEIERECATLAMTYRLQSSLFAPGATNPRQFDPTAGANRFMIEGTRLDPRMNYRIGNEGDDVSWQVYFKCVDAMEPIDPSEWRARVEVTLKGDILSGLGLANLSDLHGYDFTKLMHFFRFRCPITLEVLARQMDSAPFRLAALKLNRPIHDATPARGIDSFNGVGWRGKRNGTLAESRHLEPDDVLQDAVKGAMKRLSL